MKRTLVVILVLLWTSVVFAADPSPSKPSEKRDICDYTSHNWSDMRLILISVSRFRGKNDANVQRIAREALAGSDKFYIGEFELRYTSWASGLPGPNNAACFPRQVVFEAIKNNGDDAAAYQCVSTMNVKGKVLSISCKLVAG